MAPNAAQSPADSDGDDGRQVLDNDQPVERRTTMGSAENKQLIHAFYEFGNVGDLDQCLALMADDIKWTNIGSTKYSGVYVGKSDLTSRLLGPVFGRLKAGIVSSIDTVIAEGEFVAVQVRGKAETTEGRPYNNTYCHVFRFQDGKIAEVTEYFDTALANEVLGQ
jgi:uncharacterized protein